MLYTYCYLDLPHPPASVIESAYHNVQEGDVNKLAISTIAVPGFKEYLNRNITTRDGKKIKSAGHKRYSINEEFVNWVKNIVQQDSDGCGIAVFDGVSSSYAPHVDATRNYTLIYLLDPGGDSVDTVWYRQKGYPIERPDLRLNFDLNKVINDYSQIEEIDRHRIPLKQWVCVNSSILHSIENLSHPRVAIQLSRDDSPDHIKSFNRSIIKNHE